MKHDLELWEEGVSGATLTLEERTNFHALGSLIMGTEGFNDLYQDTVIVGRVQKAIDESVRTFIAA